jgi:predicted NBD/HSP70 family sugar kinase
LREYDLHRGEAQFTASILRALALNSRDDLVRWAQTADKLEVASLAPVVFEAATNGDEHVMKIVEDGAGVLSEYTAAVATRLGLLAPKVILLGGLFQRDAEADRGDDVVEGGAVQCLALSPDGKRMVFLSERSRLSIDMFLADVESAIRRVINLRLKAPGTFWTQDMAECFLFLRSQLLSGRWDTFIHNVARLTRQWIEPLPQLNNLQELYELPQAA